MTGDDLTSLDQRITAATVRQRALEAEMSALEQRRKLTMKVALEMVAEAEKKWHRRQEQWVATRNYICELSEQLDELMDVS